MRELTKSKGCFADNILSIVASSKIIPIIDITDDFDYQRLISLYYKYGFRTVEVRMNSLHINEIVTHIQKTYPNMYIFAGTCLSTDDMVRAKNMGLDILISPVFDSKLMEFCCLHNLAYIPCVNSIDTLNIAHSMGFSVLKFYSAEKCGGLDFLRKVYNDYDVRFMPSGGITLNKGPAYIKEPNVAACCTSHISSLQLQNDNNWIDIEKNIIQASKFLLKTSEFINE